QVDAERLVDREVRLRPLEFEPIAVRVDDFAALVLRGLQVSLGKLRDRFVEERSRSQGGLADGQPKDVGGREVRVLLEEDVERVANRELRKDLGGVVAR